MKFPKKLQQKLSDRKQANALRSLQNASNLIDFYSNDYLGFAQSEVIFDKTHELLVNNNFKINGATGSRLISGNHSLYETTEKIIANFHNAEKALLFNSGYDANVGFFSSVPQRGDIILYDELSHASIRDGIQLSNAKAYKFKHNNLTHLEEILERSQYDNIYIVTESVFSMDGDSPDVISLVNIAKKHNANVIIDEAHALGVFGEKGVGLVQQAGIEHAIFARIVTYGKALGCHGATILGSKELYEYLVNFSRSFIYTTGLSPHAIATIQVAYQHIKSSHVVELHQKIAHFSNEIQRLQLTNSFIQSTSAIHCCLISNTNKAKHISQQLQRKGFNVKSILSPTVPEGKERIRFCLHRFNSKEDITAILEGLASLV